MPKSTISAAASGLPFSSPGPRREPDYETFVAAVLEPLPEQELKNSEYNALLRQDRREAWNRAKAVTSFCRAEEDFYCAKRYFHMWIDGNLDLANLAEQLRLVALEKWRRAVANQILTPASHRADVHLRDPLQNLNSLPLRRTKSKPRLRPTKPSLPLIRLEAAFPGRSPGLPEVRNEPRLCPLAEENHQWPSQRDHAGSASDTPRSWARHGRSTEGRLEGVPSASRILLACRYQAHHAA